VTDAPPTDFDLSVVLNIHDDAIHLWRTLLSTEEAARYARHLGARVELVVVLDRPTRQAVDLVDQYEPSTFDGYQRVLVDHGSLGRSRNAGVHAARGSYVAFCDADDLISFNGFAAALESVQGLQQVVVVPEYVFTFGDVFGITRYARSDIMTPMQMVSGNQYTSRIVAPRELLSRIPIADTPPGSGYAYEDWRHNCELLAAGARFVVARNSILFYRRRPRGLSAGSWQTSTRQIPPSKLFEPSTYLEATDSTRSTAEHDALDALDHTVHFTRSELCRELLHAANQIDPAMRITRYETAPWMDLRSSPAHMGVAYRRFCEAIGSGGATFTDVVFASAEAGRPGAEWICRVLRGLAELHPEVRPLVLTEESADLMAWQDLLPHDSLASAMRDLHPSVTVDEMNVLALKAIQASGARARIHLGRSRFGARFWRAFGVLLPDRQAILHRIGAESEAVDRREFIVDDDVDLISNCLDTIHVVLASSVHVRDSDRLRFRTAEDKWHVLDGTGATSTVTDSSELERILHGDRG
jgi:hypothetical protein